MTTRVWDVERRSPQTAASSEIGGFSGVAFSPDGRTLASTCFDGRVVLTDLAGGRKRRIFRANETQGSVRIGVFSPDGTALATGGDDQAVHVWDVASGRELLTLRAHRGAIKGLTYTPDGKSIISAATDGRAITWDAGSGEIREQFDAGLGSLWSVAISRDGRSVALGGKGGITIRDSETGRSRTYRSDQGAITSLCFLPSGTALASASLEGSVTLWKLDRGDLQAWRTLEGQESRVKAMAVSPDGKTLVTGGDDAILRIWQI